MPHVHHLHTLGSWPPNLTLLDIYTPKGIPWHVLRGTTLYREAVLGDIGRHMAPTNTLERRVEASAQRPPYSPMRHREVPEVLRALFTSGGTEVPEVQEATL